MRPKYNKDIREIRLIFLNSDYDPETDPDDWSRHQHC